eukprot:9879296-Lingulodinium_polyedra.AAC.1
MDAEPWAAAAKTNRKRAKTTPAKTNGPNLASRTRRKYPSPLEPGGNTAGGRLRRPGARGSPLEPKTS